MRGVGRKCVDQKIALDSRPHTRGASGVVSHGEDGNPSGNRKSRNGNPSPTAERARSLSQFKTLKPIDKIFLGKITSHRAVTKVNANVASKGLDLRAEPSPGGRRQHGVPKSDRRGILTSAGWKRQHGDKDTPSGW